ncbi:hypothetical protein D8674_008738 [Pyrus ussuriensis x Pyrus communis]|uniref:Uncharacterized protein n=1 Tax=Pyrus ussuriensis x Pyrus communis TaxID=2448454 RepID=A0A5N5HU76_9ROSA|nr:hypothetical protein D8674_008738 [Pyrus ussuriensis x Pyrus communis]
MTGKTKNFAKNMLDVEKSSIRVWYMLADRKVAICPYLQRQLLLHYHIQGIKEEPSFNLRMMGFMSKKL